MNNSSFRYFKTELLKLKGTFVYKLVYVSAIILPLVKFVLQLLNTTKEDPNILNSVFWEKDWEIFWTLISGLIMPLVLISIVGGVTQVEYKNNTWKQVCTFPVSLFTIFLSKLLVILFLFIEFLAIFNLGVFLSTIIPIFIRLHHIPKIDFPLSLIFKENIYFFLDFLPLIAIQYSINLAFKNYLVSISIGLILLIISIAILITPFNFIVPYNLVYDKINFMKLSNSPLNKRIDFIAIIYFIFATSLGYVLFLNKKVKG